MDAMLAKGIVIAALTGLFLMTVAYERTYRTIVKYLPQTDQVLNDVERGLRDPKDADKLSRTNWMGVAGTFLWIGASLVAAVHLLWKVGKWVFSLS